MQYSIYRLNENAETPEDGELLATPWAFHEYAGFHRKSLKSEIPIDPGERFAIVVTESVIDKNGEKLYEYATNQAWAKEFAEAKGISVYGVAVVNKGESFIYIDGEWIDWSEYEVPDTEFMKAFKAATGITGDLVVTDNFSIKAYLLSDSDTEAEEP